MVTRWPFILWREDRFKADLFTETARENAQIWEHHDAPGLHGPIPRDKN